MSDALLIPDRISIAVEPLAAEVEEAGCPVPVALERAAMVGWTVGTAVELRKLIRELGEERRAARLDAGPVATGTALGLSQAISALVERANRLDPQVVNHA